MYRGKLWGRLVLGLALLPAGIAAVPDHSPASPRTDRRFGPETSIDVLLGQDRREAFATALAERRYGGRTHAWDRYADWGRQLVTRGRVADPPVGPAPSAPLAGHYRCVHCHNLQREDDRLTLPNPDEREKLIRRLVLPRPDRRDGTAPALTPGTTLWGAVNRERFYNGHYARYHRLTVADGRPMNPASLADAVQVCCRYCSAGRFPEPWELDSILAYLWELELRLKDLDLPEPTARRALDDLLRADGRSKDRTRALLRYSYPRAAKATRCEPPQRSEGDTDCYADGTRVTGNAPRGRFLYQSACAGCHGTDIHPLAGAELLKSDQRYHQFLWHGTERSGLYMPFFPAERLSRQQAADIRAYLRTLR
jgi:hypothetical protein